MKCKLLLEQRVTDATQDYEESGNVMLDRLMGGEIVARLPAGTDMQKAMEDLADELRGAGPKPSVIPGGGSTPIGALAYVAFSQELLTQSFKQSVRIATVMPPTGR